jgi:cobalamin-dependent methionine synthase I
VSPDNDRVGVFATSADIGLETDFDGDPYEKMLVQLLADRLAEAAAEKMHEDVRRHYWGYAKDEALSMADLHAERFQGIRPAVGYPSLPDTSLNFVLDELLDLKQIGIRLTESGAMRPHASVSGLMLSHPQARYFSLGKIGNDQLSDYARRRGLPIEVIKKFLAANL